MTKSITSGQLSILHSLRDGDDPLMRVAEDDLIFYQRDVGVLANLGLVDREGRRLLLTPLGERHLKAETSA